MSGIFRASAKEVWQKPRPNLLEPNEANPGNSVTPDGQRPKWRWQNPRQNLRVDSVIHQDAPINDSTDNGESHRRPSPSVQWLPMFNRNRPATLTGNLDRGSAALV
jgi:hypothetical protein